MITVSNYNAGSAYSTSTSGISTIQEGPGINVQNPNGPTVNIANSGVISLETSTPDLTIIDNLDGSWTIDYYPHNPWELDNSVNENRLVLNCNTESGEYNPSVLQGDQAIVATGTLGNERLVLTTESSTNASVEIGGAGVQIGAGGTSNSPQSYLTMTGTETQLYSGGSMSITAFDNLNIVAISNIVVTGTTGFDNVIYCNGVMPSSTDSSTTIPTTAWVQSCILGSAKTYTEKYTLDGQVITIPQGVQFVDLVVIGQGGLCGATSSNGLYYGGSGSGGTTCTLLKMCVRTNQYFTIDYAPNFFKLSYSDPTTGTSPTSSTQICYVPNGGNGGDGSEVQNGTGGTQGAAPTLSSTYGTWTTLYGTNGVQAQPPGQIFTTPARAGAPRGRPYVEEDTGCGQKDLTEDYGRGAVYITYYYL